MWCVRDDTSDSGSVMPADGRATQGNPGKSPVVILIHGPGPRVIVIAKWLM